jgi:hypothetical protein
VGAACDHHALVALLVADKASSATLKYCAYRGECRDMTPPPDAPGGIAFPADIARVEGATIVSIYSAGIVRVASTRDDGETWTPFSVAFDTEELESDMVLAAPARLMALGEQLLLYGGAERADAAYWVLISDDLGASFHAP